MNSLKTFTAKDYDLQKFQSNVSEFARDVVSHPLSGAKLLENVSLVSATTNEVLHTLNRPISGYLITRKSANANVWDTASADERKSIILNCSANVVVSLLVF